MGEIQNIVSLVVFNLFFLIFIIAIIIFIKQYRLKKKEHQDILARQQMEHQKEILATELEMQQQTMQEIGREIHDNVGQKLTLASIYTQQLSYQNQAPQVSTQIENITALINQSLSDLRTLSKTLTDNIIETNNLSKLLKTECQKINDLKVCKVVYNSNLKNLDLDYQTKAVLLRIVQEFLQNSLKHSGCNQITISLKHANEIVTLALEDDGNGFDPTQTKSNGIGLSNMKKRTEMIGGVFNFETQIGLGTKLIITISPKV
jgi:signal transduction histidine kinase